MSKLGLSPFSNTYPLSADDETPLRKNNFKKFKPVKKKYFTFYLNTGILLSVKRNQGGAKNVC